jgi:mannan-binding protein/uncharacterized protein DUF3298
MPNKALALTGAVAVTALMTAPIASATAASFCTDLAGDWDGQYCHTTVVSERKAIRDIKIRLPGDLLDNPTTAATIRPYLQNLVSNWKNVGTHMVQDSYCEENFTTFEHGATLSVVFHEDYHADGPRPNNAYRTFTFDTTRGTLLALTDVVKPGVERLAAISSLGQPFIDQALDRAAPPHNPGTYPFTADRWTPDKVYSGAYKAWALTPDELILFMPDYPVAHDDPINYTPGIMQWSMDGGTVEAHIPLTALTSVLRSIYARG